ncbi:hypothetical protein [Cryobacterium zhongshanensis]|uniref:DUF4853 domain-containing protein n=1 Tax=Cryobacterium zhongshanensis TaxID=2928153 RepID=A0AA41UER5_9MICO|nr:hypothetical protein [Cryobacterium zhongshanensis]MCI4657337.1 hypothetical protein [Cryobacterium zhongshanensis]
MAVPRPFCSWKRCLAVVSAGALSIIALSGCSAPSGRADQTLLEGARHAQQEVTSLLANVPVEWLQANATDVPLNNSSYCESVIDTGPSGSAAWTYGLGYDLVKPMPNEELLKLLAPTGDGWVLRPEQTIAGLTKDPSVVNLYYDGPDGMTVNVHLDAERATPPRIFVGATSRCIRNGDTGPGTFPAPTPTSIPMPTAAQ